MVFCRKLLCRILEIQRPEHLKVQLFLLLCGICSRKSSRSLTDRLDQKDWIALWSLSLRHRVTPVMLNSLHESGVEIPKFLSSEVEAYRRNNLLKAMRHSSELVRLTALFKKNNIRFLSFKGLALLGLTGQNLNLRHCGDVDLLLIDGESVAKADALLLSQGYQRTHGIDRQLLSNKKALSFFNRCDIGYLHVTTGVNIELHFSLFNSVHFFPVSLEDLYKNRSEITIGSSVVPVMSKEDHALYLLMHGAKSGWHRLKWLVDIPLVSNNGVDYKDKDFHARCHDLGVRRVVFQGLSLAHEFLGMPVTEKYLNGRDNNIATRLLIRGAKIILCYRRAPANYDSLRSVLYTIAKCNYYSPLLRKEMAFKLSCIGGQLISLQDYKTIPLPASLFWLYYLLRPVLWLLRRLNIVR